MPKKKVKKNKKELKKEGVDPKELIKSENKTLRNFLIAIAVFVVFIVVFFVVSNSAKNFEYKGVEFEMVQEGELLLYRTDIPVIYQEREMDYNFYLRNDPRELDKIPFEGNLELAPLLALSSAEDFNCDGFGIIAIANLINLYKISGIDVVRDENATCDPEGRFAFINLQQGDETSIEKVGPSCYEVNINNCEILEATERLMLESFVEIDKLR
ncbi:MAG TPA: hypothetical protein ENH99_02995 [Candidatus Pacearchaeota archaeon]|nr:hypothetical protein [Candidatus Pacearchaeota archaeon]